MKILRLKSLGNFTKVAESKWHSWDAHLVFSDSNVLVSRTPASDPQASWADPLTVTRREPLTTLGGRWA